MRLARAHLLPLVVVASVACGDNDVPVQPLADWEGGFFAAPFPNATRQRDDGSVELGDFPNPRQSPLADAYIAAADARNVGFGRNTATWFPLSGPIDPTTLPASPVVSPSISDSVYLINVDADSPGFGEAVPVEIQLKADPETYSPANLLVLVPYQGIVLAPDTFYAAVVTTEVKDAAGHTLQPAPELSAALAGNGPMGADMQRLVQLFEQRGRSIRTIAGATVFKTGDPVESMRAMVTAVNRLTPPELLNLRSLDDFPLFTVLEGELEMPMFQTGQEPFTREGGGIEVDGDGIPIVETTETVRVTLSVPKQPLPPDGFPLVIYLAGQGGSYRQVVDRGPIDNDGDGDGPARYFANRGVASLGFEANLTGPRHPTGDTSGVDFFNVENVVALLDNHRQLATEAGFIAQAAALFEVPPALVPETDSGGDKIEFNTDHIFIYGHSTGSVVSAVALGVFPEFERGLLSGCGGSWLYNLTLKQTPPIATFVTGLIGLQLGDEPDIFDPLLNIVATLWEPIEPMNYADRWSGEVLLIGGIVDTYFLPRMIGALSMAAGLDAAAPILDASIAADVRQVGHRVIEPPAIGSFVVQYGELEGSDGHFVPFELDTAKHQHSCFVATGILPEANADPLAPCL